MAEIVCLVLCTKKCHQPREIHVILSMLGSYVVRVHLWDPFWGSLQFSSLLSSFWVWLGYTLALPLGIWIYWLCKRLFGGGGSTCLVVPWGLSAAPHSYCASRDRECLQPLSLAGKICSPIWFCKPSLCQHPASSFQDWHMALSIEKEITSGSNSIGIWGDRYLRIGQFLGGGCPTFTI